MIASAKNTVKSYLKNIPGWRTNRKIIVIESDDWGSIRMPSKEIYNKCLQAGYRVDQIAYERYDSLASEEDLELLFEILNNYKDKNGNPVVITANALVANPHFEKIEAAGFNEYHYELITDTFKKYPEHANCFNLWKKGLEEGIFYPQSHGREHLNVSMFMDALRNKDEDALFGFRHRMPGCIPKGNSKGGNKFVETLRYSDKQDKYEKLSTITDGLELFKQLFGYQSESFIPPNHIWSPDFDEAISKKGVKYYQGRRKMKEPLFNGSIKFNVHSLGEINKYGQRYLIRNATFEPTTVTNSYNHLDRCLKDISIAFQMHKPAIISSHRLNYVGFIDEKNRDDNLKILERLLKRITRRWPEVEFMNSVELGKLIDTKKNNLFYSND